MNIIEARKIIVDFISGYSCSCGDGVVIGLSGGLDSAVCATLCVEALGKNSVDLIALPYKTSHPKSLDDAKKIAKHIGKNLEIFDITQAVDSILSLRKMDDRVRIGNICARMRMIYLYDISAERNKIVVGTGNRTERLLGYATMWGDMACAIAPIGGLYKTQVRKLARSIGLPEWIIEKKPTADLWKGQTDESEMGITYELADKILYAKFEENKNREALLSDGFPESAVALVFRRYNSSHFKRRMPKFPKIEGLSL